MLTWIKQDLQMALVLKEYGFTSVHRVSMAKLETYFDNGSYPYMLPGLCFQFLKIDESITVDELIYRCARYNA